MSGDGWSITRSASRQATLPYRAAALLLWPRLDRVRLRRCGDDPHRIARLVERRTLATPECILAMLEKTAAELLRPGRRSLVAVVGPSAVSPKAERGPAQPPASSEVGAGQAGRRAAIDGPEEHAGEDVAV